MRPHNTGHWTIDGAVTSQFEQHLRAVLDLPLGSTDLRAPDTYSVMVNLLGSAYDQPARALAAAYEPGEAERKSTSTAKRCARAASSATSPSSTRTRTWL